MKATNHGRALDKATTGNGVRSCSETKASPLMDLCLSQFSTSSHFMRTASRTHPTPSGHFNPSRGFIWQHVRAKVRAPDLLERVSSPMRLSHSGYALSALLGVGRDPARNTLAESCGHAFMLHIDGQWAVTKIGNVLLCGDQDFLTLSLNSNRKPYLRLNKTTAKYLPTAELDNSGLIKVIPAKAMTMSNLASLKSYREHSSCLDIMYADTYNTWLCVEKRPIVPSQSEIGEDTRPAKKQKLAALPDLPESHFASSSASIKSQSILAVPPHKIELGSQAEKPIAPPPEALTPKQQTALEQIPLVASARDQAEGKASAGKIKSRTLEPQSAEWLRQSTLARTAVKLGTPKGTPCPVPFGEDVVMMSNPIVKRLAEHAARDPAFEVLMKGITAGSGSAEAHAEFRRRFVDIRDSGSQRQLASAKIGAEVSPPMAPIKDNIKPIAMKQSVNQDNKPRPEVRHAIAPAEDDMDEEPIRGPTSRTKKGEVKTEPEIKPEVKKEDAKSTVVKNEEMKTRIVQMNTVKSEEMKTRRVLKDTVKSKEMTTRIVTKDTVRSEETKTRVIQNEQVQKDGAKSAVEQKDGAQDVVTKNSEVYKETKTPPKPSASVGFSKCMKGFALKHALALKNGLSACISKDSPESESIASRLQTNLLQSTAMLEELIGINPSAAPEEARPQLRTANQKCKLALKSCLEVIRRLDDARDKLGELQADLTALEKESPDIKELLAQKDPSEAIEQYLKANDL